jgi:hypothetical protein
MTNTTACISFYARGLPGRTCAIQRSTNLVNWKPEGTTIITFNPIGRACIIIGTTNLQDLALQRFYRMVLVQ